VASTTALATTLGADEENTQKDKSKCGFYCFETSFVLAWIYLYRRVLFYLAHTPVLLIVFLFSAYTKEKGMAGAR